MRYLIVLLITINLYANEFAYNKPKALNENQKEFITGIIIKVMKSLRSNKKLEVKMSEYYELMSIKDASPETWSSIHNMELEINISPETPTWLIKQKLTEAISKKEKEISVIIGRVMAPYIYNKDSKAREKIITSLVTYNEKTLPSNLMGLVLPSQKDNNLKTSLVFTPVKNINSSILFTFAELNGKMNISVKEVKDPFNESQEPETKITKLD